MDVAERSKSITRLLQHSILQLCNEHVGYSNKLQILGVLCMTVDDEQHELVVKVNNTLKRVNPPPPVPSKEMGTAPPILHPAVAPIAPALASYTQALAQQMYNHHSKAEEARTASPTQSLPTQVNSSSDNNPSTSKPARKSHGRKGAKPVKVQHVFDEGDICSDDENDHVLTVIPTDPDISDTPSPCPSDLSNKTPHGSAKRKAEPQYHRSGEKSVDKCDDSHSGATGRSISAVRALLLGRAASQSGAQDLSMGRSNHQRSSSPPRGLTLPVYVAPQASERHTGNDDSPTNLSMSANSSDLNHTRADSASPSAFDRELHIKEELDEYPYTGYNNNNNSSGSLDNSLDTSPEDLSQRLASLPNYAHTNGSLMSAGAPILARSLEGLPSQIPYSIAFSSPNKLADGLSIQYTNTGPITVGTNGKNMSQLNRNTKVKDIILYDDSVPLHEQRGNRIETDYMLDSFGLEGRKRRRRNADESLTSEEIAEYLGSVDGMSQLFKCKYCTEELTDLTQYLQHTLTMHHCYICHQCGKSFTTKSSLLRHRPIHTGMRRFACSICKKTFYRKDKCKAHIKRHLTETGEKAEVEHCDQVDAVPSNLSLMDSPGHMMDNPGHMMDTPGHMMDTPGHMMDTPGHMMDTPGHMMDTPGHMMDTPGHMMDNPGHMMDNPGHMMDTPGHMMDTPGHIMDTPGHMMDTPPPAMSLGVE